MLKFFQVNLLNKNGNFSFKADFKYDKMTYSAVFINRNRRYCELNIENDYVSENIASVLLHSDVTRV